MPAYIINADQYLWYDLDNYLDAIEQQADGDILQMLYAYPIADLFIKVKRRIAMRGKQAKDQAGESLLENHVITDDELDLFMDWLRTESARVFKKISAYSKNIDAAFRFNVKFGDPLASSVVTDVSVDNLTITDDQADMTVNEYAGMKFVITEPGVYQNQERTIVSNTATAFVLNSAFTTDITDMDYVVSAQTEDHILIYAICDTEVFDTNLFELIDSLFEKAFIGGVLKEWYLLNRFMEDYQVEDTMLKEAISDLRSSFFQTVTNTRTLNSFF